MTEFRRVLFRSEKLEDDSFRGFSEEEKDQLVSLLLRVFENLRDMK